MIISTLLLLVATGSSSATVTLSKEAFVRGTELHLGDVAQIEASDPKVVADLEGLHLGYAPAPGFTRVLRAGIIKQALRRRNPGVEVTFEGKERTVVRPETTTIAAQNILAVSQDAIARRYKGLDATWTPTRPMRDEVVPAGTDGHGLVARISNRIETVGGTVNVGVEIRVDQQVYRTVWVPFNVELYRELPVLARPVQAGEQLSSKNLVYRRMKVGGPRMKALAPAAIEDAVAVRAMAAGVILRATDVHRPLLIRKGDFVHLQVRKGKVTARVSAKAVDGGHRGDRVRVVTIAGREFMGTVLGRDMVEIRLGGKYR